MTSAESRTVDRAFLPLIRQLERELRLPTSDRVRILRELEGDLESMRDDLLAEGVPESEAARRAVEILAPDAITLERLGRLHEPPWQRVTRNLADDRLRLLERTLLAVCTGGVTLASALMLLRADLLATRSPFMVPMLILGALMVAAILSTGFRTWVRFDETDSPTRAWPVLFLAGAAIATALVGTVADFHRMAIVLEQNPANDIVLATDWLLRDAALCAVALVIALAGGLTWFVTHQWLTLIRGERLAFLDLETRLPILKEF